MEPDLYDYPPYNGSAGLYESILPATRDGENVYMKLTPVAETNEQTVSLKADPTLPTDPSELTMDHLAKADPRQAQLWMLLQIQKMVQKMEDMYESAGYLKPPTPLPPTETEALAEHPKPPSVQPSTSTETDDLYESVPEYSKLPSLLTTPSATEGKQLPPAIQGSSRQVQENQPTRKDIYVNLSGITQKKGTCKPLPPLPPPPTVPPKTYKKISYVQVSESSPPDSASRLQQTPAQGDTIKDSQIEMYKKSQQKMIGEHIQLEIRRLVIHYVALFADTLVARSKTLSSEIVEQLVVITSYYRLYYINLSLFQFSGRR